MRSTSVQSVRMTSSSSRRSVGFNSHEFKTSNHKEISLGALFICSRLRSRHNRQNIRTSATENNIFFFLALNSVILFFIVKGGKGQRINLVVSMSVGLGLNLLSGGASMFSLCSGYSDFCPHLKKEKKNRN